MQKKKLVNALLAAALVFLAAAFGITVGIIWFYRDKGPTEAYAEQNYRLVPVQSPAPIVSPVPSSPPAPSPSPTPPPVYTANVLFVGDLMVHTDQMISAKVPDTDEYDFHSMLAPVAEAVSEADYAVGNLELTFAGKDIGYSDFPVFNAPDSFGRALYDAGFDFVSTANNHCMDKGSAGALRTLDVLDGLGIAHAGTYRDEAARNEIFIKEINGISFAFLSYTYGTNGIPVPRDMPYLVNILDEGLIKADIARAKALNPDIIVALPHMGNEYELTPRDVFKSWADVMLEAGADVVIASHPHVVQPMAFMNKPNPDGTTRECFVAYSMGNFVSGQRTLPREAGVMLCLTFEKTGDTKPVIKAADYTPTWVKYTSIEGKRDMVVYPVPAVLRAAADGEDVRLRDKDIARVKAVRQEIARQLLGRELPDDALEDKTSLLPLREQAAP